MWAGVEHIELVLANCEWLARQHPLEALKVFTGTGAAITDAEMLPRYKILDFIRDHQPRLAIPYLVSMLNLIFLVYL